MTELDEKQADWTKNYIVYKLHEKGLTLSGLSRSVGLSSTTLSNALTRPWAKGENHIAEALGVLPSVIWPSRYYDKNGSLIEREMRKPKKSL